MWHLLTKQDERRKIIGEILKCHKSSIQKYKTKVDIMKQEKRDVTKTFRITQELDDILQEYSAVSDCSIGGAIFESIASFFYPENATLKKYFRKVRSSKGEYLWVVSEEILTWLSYSKNSQRKYSNIYFVKFLEENFPPPVLFEEIPERLYKNFRRLILRLQELSEPVELIDPSSSYQLIQCIDEAKEYESLMENDSVYPGAIVSFILDAWGFIYDFDATYIILQECVKEGMTEEPSENLCEPFREALCKIAKEYSEEDYEIGYVGSWDKNINLISQIKQRMET